MLSCDNDRKTPESRVLTSTRSHFRLKLDDATFVVLLTTLFLLAGFLGILNHEMWRDELQSWLIARDSRTVGELLQNMRYEGHPAFWYVCLFAITRFTHDPLAMQVFHLVL